MKRDRHPRGARPSSPASSTTTLQRVVIGGLVVALVVLVGALFETGTRGRVVAPEGVARTTPARPAAPVLVVEGKYRVVVRSTTSVAPFGGRGEALHGETELDVELVVHEREGSPLTIEVAGVTTASVRVNGEETLTPEVLAALPRVSLLTYRVGAARFGDVQADKKLPREAVRAIQLAASELLVETLAFGDGDVRREPLTWGTLVVKLEDDRCLDGACTRQTTSTGVEEVRGIELAPLITSVDRTGRVVSDGAHLVRAIDRGTNVIVTAPDGAERYSVRGTLHAERTGDVDRPRPRLEAVHVARHLDEIPLSHDAEERARAARIDGLTPAAFRGALDEAAASGVATDHDRFLWRATELLRADPRLIDELAPRYRATTAAAHPYRALLLDLLVGAGTPQAQRTLVELARHRVTRADARGSLLYQRLALLDAPTDLVISALREDARRAWPFQRAALVGLGNAARARSDVDERTARAIVDELAAARAGAPGRPELLAAILALGNTHRDDVVDVLAPGVTDVDPEVRHATAEALGHVVSDDARADLLRLARDASGPVARRALTSLRRHTLRDEEVGRLAIDVAAHAIPDDALAELVTLAAADFRTRAASRQVLEAIVARDTIADRQLKSRVRQMLSR